MKLLRVFLIAVSTWSISACGARTSEDEFLGYDDGEHASGGSPGSGGRPAATGGAPAGGTPGAGGASGGAFSAGGDFSTGGRPIGTGGSSGGAFPGNTCCDAHDDVGCSIPFIEECTCNLDEYCCDNQWDERCVSIADRACFAGCSATGGQPGTGGAPGAGGSVGDGGSGAGGSNSGGAGAGGDSGNCCDTHNSTGCQDMNVTACTCALDSFCCESYWDSFCVQEAEAYCKADCGAGGSVSSGGSVSAGGAVGSGGDGSGGSGGSPQSCEFFGACGGCLCQNCLPELAACQGDQGCFAIAWCVQGSACLPVDCYKPAYCKDVIDTYGGLTGPSAQNALGLSSCLLSSSCACQ